MRKQVATMVYKGQYKVVFDSDQVCNPYYVYRISDGHRKLVVRYADLASCMMHLSQIINNIIA